MNKFVTAIAALSFSALGAGNASAGDTFTVKFNYAPTTETATTYATISKTAMRACKNQARSSVAGMLGSSAVRDCQTDLVAKAVTATKNDKLIAFHGGK